MTHRLSWLRPVRTGAIAGLILAATGHAHAAVADASCIYLGIGCAEPSPPPVPSLLPGPLYPPPLPFSAAAGDITSPYEYGLDHVRRRSIVAPRPVDRSRSHRHHRRRAPVSAHD